MSTDESLTKNRKTPGVYVTEINAFGPSVASVATAVPAFIGYTQQGRPFQPVRCGVPATMPPLDVLDGYMSVHVTLQMIQGAS